MSLSTLFIQQCLQSMGSSSEWTISTRQGDTTIINSYSADQFLPYLFMPQHQPRECQEYLQRQQYALPFTPKIILARNDKRSCQEMLLLVQRGQYDLAKFVGHSRGDLKSELQLVLQILNTAEMLQRKYGYFRFTEAMIRAAKGPALVLWINESEVCNSPQHTIIPVLNIKTLEQEMDIARQRDPAAIMLYSLLSIVGKKMACREIVEELLTGHALNFEQVRRQLMSHLRIQNNSQCTIYASNEDKYRRYTQGRLLRAPEFLLQNKRGSGDKSETGNRKSLLAHFDLTESKHIKHSERSSVTDSVKNGPFHKKDHVVGSSDKNRLKTVNFQQPQRLHKNRTIQVHFAKTAKKSPYQSGEKLPIKAVRDSGKTASTSGQFIEGSSTGSFSFKPKIERDTFNRLRVEKNYGKKPQRNKTEYTPPNFSEEEIPAPISPREESYVIENGNKVPRDRPVTSKPQPQPSLTKPNCQTQQSIMGPESQFYKDVSKLLHSRVIEDLDKSIQGQFNKILFD